MSADDRSVDEQIRDLIADGGVAHADDAAPLPRGSGSYSLVVHYYGGRSEYRYRTAQEAIQRAIGTLDTGEAWPVKIGHEGEVLWQMDESIDSRESLTQILRASR